MNDCKSELQPESKHDAMVDSVAARPARPLDVHIERLADLEAHARAVAARAPCHPPQSTIHQSVSWCPFVSLRGSSCPFVDFFFWALVDNPSIGFK